jgi:hypothetical protein
LCFGDSLGFDFSRHDFVDVAPYPQLSGLNRPHYRMLCLVKMLGGVFVFRRVAAGRVSADKAHSQVNPRVARLHAVFANMFFCFSDLDLVQVSAFLRHRFLLRIAGE